jgi:RNA polymerase sigma-70 factor (sigma-E family)
MMAVEMGAPQPPVWDDPLQALYRERYAPMVRLAYLLSGDRAVAEELVQDAFISVHRNWARATNPSAYLRTAVVNACNSWGRRRALEVLRRPAAPDPSVLDAEELWDTLVVLPMRQRAAIVLRFYEDLPDDRIAELLGCRPATVRTAIHRGLARLRKELPR